MMCASSRYGGEAQGSDKTSRSVPRTLIASDPAFEVGANLAVAASRDGGMFAAGAVKFCQPYCAQFCVLGGGSCAVRPCGGPEPSPTPGGFRSQASVGARQVVQQGDALIGSSLAGLGGPRSQRD